MSKLSVIIPARNEPYLTKTVNDVFEKARGSVEVIVCLDGGDWPDGWAETSERYAGKLITIYRGKSLGMRDAINRMAAIASGDFLMKTDAHCAFAKGFDETMKAACGERTIAVPRRYRLNGEKWARLRDGRPPVDYEYLSAPDGNGGGLKGKVWDQRTVDRKNEVIDDLWLFQGSCWLMRRDYFYELDLMDDENYGTFWKEALELSCKSWLSGGRVVTVKSTWYAHVHKSRRGYSLPSAEEKKAQAYCVKWLDDSTGWRKQTLPFASLLQRFNPPGWENWKGTNGFSEVPKMGRVPLEILRDEHQVPSPR